MHSPFKNIAALALAGCLGMVAATTIPGCQPADKPAPPMKPKPAPSSNTTDSGSPPAKATPSAPVPEEKSTPAAKPEDTTPAPPEKTPEAEKPDPSDEPKPKPEGETTAENAPPVIKPAPEVEISKNTADIKTPAENPVMKAGDWNQWGGSSLRNNVPVVDSEKVPTEFAPGEFDRNTGKWNPASSKNIKWVAALGSQTYGNTVVSNGKVYIGTNNGAGYLKRYPADTDLGCLIAFDEKTGKFLWQDSSEKLPTGRVHDWPLMGVCCSVYAEGDRVWYVSSRGEVKCVDAEGFYDDEDDGPVKNQVAKLFDMMRAEEVDQDKVGPAIKALDEGKLPDGFAKRFANAGSEVPDDVTVSVKEPGKKWEFKAKSGEVERTYNIALQGPRLVASKMILPIDKEEADVVWAVDMMKQLGTSQHNMCSCSITAWGDLLFVNSSNGVHEDHKTITAPDAPSFICMNKHTGEIFWKDNSPGSNILHGQWSSPAVGIIDGVPQVIFGGGDGWVYSFKADTGKDGKGELLWKFDVNDKEALLELGGRGTKNDIIATPVIYDNKVYFLTGQDPEHGEGKGIIWCVDPTKRGDISESLAVNASDPNNVTPIPTRRIQNVIVAEGDKTIPNPNSGVIFKLTECDWDGDGKIDDFMERVHRGIGTCAIKDDLMYVADFSGLFFCIDAKDSNGGKGKILWAHDMLAAAWGSPLIAGDKVYIGDEDGDILVFNLSREKEDPIAEINMNNAVYSSPIIANDVLYIANKDHLFAIENGASPMVAEGGKSGE